MLRIAEDCVKQGHSVTIYTGEWRGDLPQNIHVKILPSSGWLNHQRHRSLIKAMHAEVANNPVDAVVGFNRMAGLDVYYAADPCFIERAYEDRSWFYRLSSRYRFFRNCEKAVFSRQSRCHILLLTQHDKDTFQHWYHTQEERLIVLPPNIAMHKFEGKDKLHCRTYLRQQFSIPVNAKVVLTVGSAYIRKGVDRVLVAIASLPPQERKNTWLIAIGEYESNNTFARDAEKLCITNQVIQVGGRPDVADLMIGADLLAHPARSELAGLVITEAITAGLPVLVTANCGYAQHVEKADAGIVTQLPFRQEIFNQQFLEMLTSSKQELWPQNAIQYVKKLLDENADKSEAKIIISIAERNMQLETRANL